jgi:hypothetical protein
LKLLAVQLSHTGLQFQSKSLKLLRVFLQEDLFP